MKKLFLLLVVTMVCFSCSKESDDSNNEENLSNIEASSIFNATIGKIENGAFIFTVTEKSILESTSKIPAIEESKTFLTHADVEEIEGKKYLRIYGSDDSITTIELNINVNDGSVQTRGVSCSSTACATGGGCIPNGSYCTRCVVQNFPLQIGDCKRTTSTDD